VISETSLNSEICGLEINHAANRDMEWPMGNSPEVGFRCVASMLP
jgi:hypothetical protein